MMVRTELFLALLLPSIASAHLSIVCTSGGFPECKDTHMYFGTYHPTPSAGSSVPGDFFLKSPNGEITTGKFNIFKHVNPVNGIAIKENDLAGQMHASLRQEWGLHADDSINCYGLKSTTPISTGPPALWGAQIVPPSDNTDTCHGKLETWYRATITNVTSGTYEVWSSGTDQNLAPQVMGNTPSGKPCELGTRAGLENRFVFDVSACDGGKSCSGFVGTVTDANIPTSCQSQVFSGFLCPATCPGKSQTGELLCDDGVWVNTLQCADETCNKPTDADYMKIVGIEGSGCGFSTPKGTVCTPACPIGWYAPPSDRLTCGAGGNWNCTQAVVAGGRRLSTCGCVECPKKDGLKCTPPAPTTTTIMMTMTTTTTTTTTPTITTTVTRAPTTTATSMISTTSMGVTTTTANARTTSIADTTGTMTTTIAATTMAPTTTAAFMSSTTAMGITTTMANARTTTVADTTTASPDTTTPASTTITTTSPASTSPLVSSTTDHGSMTTTADVRTTTIHDTTTASLDTTTPTMTTITTTAPLTTSTFVPLITTTAGVSTCRALTTEATDQWCTNNCNHVTPFCPPRLCQCGIVTTTADTRTTVIPDTTTASLVTTTPTITTITTTAQRTTTTFVPSTTSLHGATTTPDARTTTIHDTTTPSVDTTTPTITTITTTAHSATSTFVPLTTSQGGTTNTPDARTTTVVPPCQDDTSMPGCYGTTTPNLDTTTPTITIITTTPPATTSTNGPSTTDQGSTTAVVRKCFALTSQATDEWCTSNCNHASPFCPSQFCRCGADSSRRLRGR